MKPLVLITLLLTASVLPAQKQYFDDAQVRTHLNVETKLGKRFTVHLDQQYRFTNNISEFKRGSADIGVTYKINKHLKLLADYVYIQKARKEGGFSQRNWYYGAAVGKVDFGYFRLVGRAMVQARHGATHSDKQNLVKLYNRDKLSLRYQATKRFTFYVSEEIYILLNNPQTKGIDRTRSAVGMLMKTFKNQEIEFYFMYQAETQDGDWWDQSDKYPDLYLDRDFIYGIGYGIEF